MSINPNASAQPHNHLNSCPSCGSGGKAGSIGLTIREHFAAMAMQGIVRRFGAQGDCSTTVALDARDAVRYADALIAELNK